MRRTQYVAGLLALLVVACGSFSAAVRSRAADDLHCSSRQISLQEIKPYRQSQAYLAEGCGQRQAYEGTCDRRNCNVEPIPSGVPLTMLNGTGAGVTGGTLPGRVIVRSQCSRTVRLFHGEKPKASGGMESPINSDEARGFDSGTGQTLWLLDDAGEGVTSVTIGPGEHRLHVGPDCKTLVPD